MKKTLLFLAMIVTLAGLAAPANLMADGNPYPICSDGKPCKPLPPSFNGK